PLGTFFLGALLLGTFFLRTLLLGTLLGSLLLRALLLGTLLLWCCLLGSFLSLLLRHCHSSLKESRMAYERRQIGVASVRPLQKSNPLFQSGQQTLAR